MKPVIVRKWLAALRSGKYTQATGLLRKVRAEGRTRRDRMGHCCLGVLSDVVCNFKAVKDTGWEYDKKNGVWRSGDNMLDKHLPTSVVSALGGFSPEARQDTFSAMNDEGGKTFSQIAAFIEKNLLPAPAEPKRKAA